VTLLAYVSDGAIVVAITKTNALVGGFVNEIALEELTTPFTPTASDDLALSAKVLRNPVQVGQEITYTALVTNNGPDVATNALVVDALPSSLNYRSASTTRGSCGATTMVVCNLGALNNGNTATIIIAATTSVTGLSANTLSVASDTSDPNTNNNTQVLSVTVTSVPQPSADLSVSANAPSAVQVGNAITYTVAIANAGPDPANNVQLNDALPSGLTYQSASSSQGSCSGTSTVTCNLNSIANGNSTQVTIVATASVTGTVVNTLNVSSSTAEPSATNNTVIMTTTVSASPPSFKVYLPLAIR